MAPALIWIILTGRKGGAGDKPNYGRLICAYRKGGYPQSCQKVRNQFPFQPTGIANTGMCEWLTVSSVILPKRI